MRVYVVDDEPTIRHLFAYALKRDGYHVGVFESGAELVRLRPTEPDVLVIDLVMPRVNGDEVVQICRGDWGWRHMKVCMITGSLMFAPSSFAGTDLVLEKPIPIERLLQSVKTLLPKPQPHRHAATAPMLPLPRL